MNAPPQPDLIFDIGAHRGEDSAFYLRMGYRVVAVEAHPELARGLCVRFTDEIAAGRLTVIDKAIAETDGPVRFFVNEDVSVWGTTSPEWVERNAQFGARSHEVVVESVRFEALIAQFGCPHYLKIDVEGADLLCVKALRGNAMRPRFLSIESGSTWRELQTEFDALEVLGYRKFKVIDQQYHADGWFADRTGAPFQHRFEPESSGPFGEQLPGPWLTRSQAMRRYARVLLLYRLIGDRARLQAVIRRVPLVRRVLKHVTWYDTHATLDA